MSEPHRPNPGDLVDDFVLPDAAGQPQRLSELASAGWVALVFYRGHW